MPSEITSVRQSRLVFPAVLAFFVASGVCGLLYQIVWTRKLVLLFGTTSYAVSTVLSIFFLGLGVGSWWGGRLADRGVRSLRLYGFFEILIGAWAIVFILLIDRGEGLAVSLLRDTASTRTGGIAIRATLALAYLIVPVTLMGATLPLLARFVSRDMPRVSRIGALYTLNTLGAVAGCLAVGFWLIESFGYNRTTLIGAALNVTIGVLALVLSRAIGETAEEEAPREDSPRGIDTPFQDRLAMILVACAFAVSGFCCLALEVIWTRLLAIVFLGTTYAFTTVLATVLFGIATGSAFASWLTKRRVHPVATFGVVQFATGTACFLMLSVFPGLPGRWLEHQRSTGYSWEAGVQWKFWLCFSVLLLPTLLFGMSFPLAVQALPARATLARSVGRLYSANTLGGVLGALAGGFIIIPLFGAHDGIVLLAWIMAFSGAFLVFAARPQRTVGIVIATAAIVFTMFSHWITREDVSRAVNQWFIPEDHHMIHYAEGVEGTVVVTEPRQNATGTGRYLWINAVQATASIDKGVKMNRFQGVLPLLFDRSMDTALFMCFGSGITAGTLGMSPFSRIDAVEISRTVLDAGSLFAVDNFGVLENPRMNFIVDDGRNFLLTTKNAYDLITFEPMPLAIAGVSAFYTREYYELCKARLVPGGLVSQWVPIHSLNDAVVRSMMATFNAVFPYRSMWFINADLFLIGSNAPLAIDYAKANERIFGNAPLAAGLREVYLPDIEELLACHFMDAAVMDAYAAGAPIMTDDRPWAEFAAPKLIYERDAIPDALDALAPYRESPAGLLTENTAPDTLAAVDRRFRAHVQDFAGLKVYYARGIGSTPQEGFRKSLEIDPNDANAKYYLAKTLSEQGAQHLRWDDRAKAEPMLLEALEYAPNRLDILLTLADAYTQWNDPARAAEYYARYTKNGGTAKRPAPPKR
ncbi:MAG: fused MFS/spermidine synthase [Candidatus Hydrogenedentota bacterium]